MSGFTGGGGYDLTATKAMHWHGSRDCDCRDLVDVARTHLESAGFSWQTGSGGNYLYVRGPGLAEESTGPLFEAVSGRRSWR